MNSNIFPYLKFFAFVLTMLTSVFSSRADNKNEVTVIIKSGDYDYLFEDYASSRYVVPTISKDGLSKIYKLDGERMYRTLLKSTEDCEEGEFSEILEHRVLRGHECKVLNNSHVKLSTFPSLQLTEIPQKYKFLVIFKIDRDFIDRFISIPSYNNKGNTSKIAIPPENYFVVFYTKDIDSDSIIEISASMIRIGEYKNYIISYKQLEKTSPEQLAKLKALINSKAPAPREGYSFENPFEDEEK